ncbi:hypothetical protein ACP275_10G114800 [Erythranthe tilingii]
MDLWLQIGDFSMCLLLPWMTTSFWIRDGPGTTEIHNSEIRYDDRPINPFDEFDSSLYEGGIFDSSLEFVKILNFRVIICKHN